MTKVARIQVGSFKIAVPLDPAKLPRDLVPAEGPTGEPVIEMTLEGGSLTFRAKVNGKNYRKMLRQIDEAGPANMAVVLQGVLKPGSKPGGPFDLEGAGFQAVVKTPKPPPGPAPTDGASGAPREQAGHGDPMPRLATPGQVARPVEAVGNDPVRPPLPPPAPGQRQDFRQLQVGPLPGQPTRAGGPLSSALRGRVARTGSA